MVLPISEAELNSLETSSGSQIPDGSHRWPALEKSLSVLTLETGLPNRRGSVSSVTAMSLPNEKLLGKYQITESVKTSEEK